MDALFIYVAKVNIALIFFFLFYTFLFRRDTFTRAKRFYLLLIIFFSFGYPLISIEPFADTLYFIADVAKSKFASMAIEDFSVVSFEANSNAQASFLKHGFFLISLIWVAVSLFFALRFLWQLFSIIRIRLNSQKKRIYDVPLYHLSKGLTPFSFFKWVFVNTESHSEEELRQIILHENTHACQWHSFDIVLAELVCILFWWNPIVWMIKKEIVINLEYLADEGVLHEGYNAKEYQYLLLRLSFEQGEVGVVNNFNASQLKSRVVMMNQSKSPSRKLIKYAMVIPVIFIFIFINSIVYAEPQPNQSIQSSHKTAMTELSLNQMVPNEKEENSLFVKAAQESVFVVTDNEPEFHGGSEALMKFLADNVEYPYKARRQGVRGRVVCQFVVTKDGNVDDVTVVRSIHPLLDAEAVRVLSVMPKWKPGTQRGKPVNVRFTLPIRFDLK